MSWIFLGALCGALAVVAGAFGAHALAAGWAARAALWETAARYLMYGGFALVAGRPLRAAGRRGAALDGAGWCLLLGSLIFSGTVFGSRWAARAGSARSPRSAARC